MPRRALRYSTEPDVAATGALIGDPVRAAMLYALIGGGTLPATELAARSGASAQAASAHLARLTGGGLLTAERAGRQRLYRLASADVGRALEALALISAPARITGLAQSSEMKRLRRARSCYDHMAG